MKIISLLFLVFILINLVSVVAGPTLLDVTERVQFYVDACPYNITDYSNESFDCTNMAAQLHDYLQTKNIETEYCLGYGGVSDSRFYHAWLETDMLYIEATRKTVDLKDNNAYYKYIVEVCNSEHGYLKRFDTPEQMVQMYPHFQNQIKYPKNETIKICQIEKE